MESNRDARHLVTTIPAILLGVVVLFVAGFFLWVVGLRVGYPFELEWMEGAMADHVCRVLDGKLIYTAPAYDHVAFLYHPGYFYAAGLIGFITGPGFLALRLVSILATLGSCVFVFRLAKRDGNRLGGIAAVGVFLGAFSLAGCYYDVGRIDPLFTCLLLGGIDLTRSAKTWKGLSVATFVFLLAWLTKQTALVILPFVVLGCMPSGFRRATLFGCGIAMVCGLTVWILDLVHDGWLSYFTLELPRNHGILREFYTAYWTHDVLPFLLAVALFAVFLIRARSKGARPFHAAWIIGCVVGSFLSRLHVGGAANVLIPMIGAMAVACGLGLAHCATTGGGRYAVALCAATLQVALLFVLPWGQLISPNLAYAVPVVPSEEMRGRSERRLDEMRQHDGPVFLPWHGYLALMAGKEPTAHSMAMDDVWRSGNEEAIRTMNDSLRTRLQRAPFPLVYVDDVGHQDIRGLLLGLGYRPTRPLADEEHQLVPPVGTALWPKVVLRR